MTVSISDFWRLAVESRLLAPGDCQQLEANFAGVKGASSQSNAATLARMARRQWRADALSDSDVACRPRGAVSITAIISPTTASARKKAGWPVCCGPCMCRRAIRRALYRHYRRGGKGSAVVGRWRRSKWPGPARSGIPSSRNVINCSIWATQSRRDRRFAGRSRAGCRAARKAPPTTRSRLDSPAARLAPADACRLAYQARIGIGSAASIGTSSRFGAAAKYLASCRRLGASFCKRRSLPSRPWGPGRSIGTPPIRTAKLLLAADYAAPELAQARPIARYAHRRLCAGGDAVSNAVGLAAVSGGRRGEQALRACVGIAGVFGVSLECRSSVAQLVGFLMAKDPAGRYQIGGASGRGVGVFRRSGRAKLMPQPADRQPYSIIGWKPAATAGHCAGSDSDGVRRLRGIYVLHRTRRPNMQRGVSHPHPSSTAHGRPGPFPQETSGTRRRRSGQVLEAAANSPTATSSPAEPSFCESIQPAEPAFEPAGFAAIASETLRMPSDDVTAAYGELHGGLDLERRLGQSHSAERGSNRERR